MRRNGWAIKIRSVFSFFVMLLLAVPTVYGCNEGKTKEAAAVLPFLDRMTICFFAIVFIMMGISLLKPESEQQHTTHIIEVDKSMFKVSSEFIIGSFIISGVLVALYTVFW